MSKAYFHEVVDRKKFDTLAATGMTWDDLAEKYKQPDWCGYHNAIGPFGCWSLIGFLVDGKEYCKDCDLCKDKSEPRMTTKR